MRVSSPKSLWIPLLLAGALASLAPTCQSQLPGLDEPVPVGPFLDGAFPTDPPPLGRVWGVVDAFPDVLVDGATAITPNPADDRLYVGSRDGRIHSFENDPLASGVEPFMDISDRAAVVSDGGFLGLVFHPEFGLPGSPYEFTFYAYYNSNCPIDADVDVDLDSCTVGFPTGDFSGFQGLWLRLSRFQATFDSAAGVWRGDPDSEEPMITLRQVGGTHYGGGMAFDGAGDFYLTIGDQNRYDTAQEIEQTLEGGMMRLVVDILENPDGSWSCPAGSHLPIRTMEAVSGHADEVSGRLYCIPDDNPWVDPSGVQFEEYYTLGNRNPHRLSYDPVTGFMWSGEIGERSREEVNVLQKGGNYGWPFREGLIAGPNPPPPSILGVLTDPVIDFGRADAAALIGGYVYRGNRLPELTGRYLAGDYITGKVFAIDLDEITMTATAEYLTQFTPGGLATFGQDASGEVFLGSVTSLGPLQQLERVFVSTSADPPEWLSMVGAFDSLSTLDVHDGAVPYGLVPFWSDGAQKYRWIFLPNDGAHDDPSEQIVFQPDDSWTFPVGTVLMKHFELALDENTPDVTTRLETRFLVQSSPGVWYGVTYRWEPDQSDARLLLDQELQVYTVQEAGGGSREQTWLFPSPNQCATCHSQGAGFVLGPRTHQLNRPFTYPTTGRRKNQLKTWIHLGMFGPSATAYDDAWPSMPDLDDPMSPVQERARSWLDTNCGYCHRPGTGNPAAFDARFTTPLVDQNLVWGPTNDSLGAPDAYLVKPGEPLSSTVFLRAASVDAILMPPLAKDRVHTEGVSLLAQWIGMVDPAFPAPGNAPPTVAHPGNQSAAVGDPVLLAMVASDPDEDDLFFTSSPLPDGLVLDSATGVISGTLGPGSGGTTAVTVGVSDGPEVSSTSFLWLVSGGDLVSPLVSITSPGEGEELSGTVVVQADASDDVGVVGVHFLLNGVPLGDEDTAAPYEVAWNTLLDPEGNHTLVARARDAAGNTTESDPVAVSVLNLNRPEPVGAWSFAEGSGTTAADASSFGNDGSVSGALWTSEGVFGGALEFDGDDDVVIVPDSDSLDLLTGRYTLSAWVRPNVVLTGWKAILQKEENAYFLNAHTPFGGPGTGAELGGFCCTNLALTTPLPADTWTHVAATYDGTTQRFYIDGVQLTTGPANGPPSVRPYPLRIGNNTYQFEGFSGRIDQVRVYDRALSPAEVLDDMTSAITPGDP